MRRRRFQLALVAAALSPLSAPSFAVEVEALNPTKNVQGCSLLYPTTVGEWDLTGDGRNDVVKIEKRAQGDSESHIVVFDGHRCSYYPTPIGLGGSPLTYYSFTAKQMDDKPGLELVIVPRGYNTYQGAIRVIHQRSRKWYLVDFAEGYRSYYRVGYFSPRLAELDGEDGAEFAVLGEWVEPSPGDSSSLFVHMFGLLPKPHMYQTKYDVTVPGPDDDYAVGVFNNQMLIGHTNGHPGKEVAVVIPFKQRHYPFTGYSSAHLFIVNDENGTMREDVYPAFNLLDVTERVASAEFNKNGKLVVIIERYDRTVDETYTERHEY